MEISRAQIGDWINGLYRATGADGFFGTPFFAVASAEDSYWTKFKSIISSSHWTPQEALSIKYSDSIARSVIVWILPINEAARKENRLKKDKPSVSWARVRSFGELANMNMRTQLCRLIVEAGQAAVAPQILMNEQKIHFKGPDFFTPFSERHAAFVAGLGTFSMSAGLITEKGVAHRIGAVVTDIPLEADKRPYGDDVFAWCNSCGACIKRCPASAIGPGFKDRNKAKCAEYQMNVVTADRIREYGWLDYTLGCGLCQTAVPCEFKIPGGISSLKK